MTAYGKMCCNKVEIYSEDILYFSEESSKNNALEEVENLKNAAESLQNNLDKTEECKENKDIMTPNIKECEPSPDGDGKTLNTSDSGEFSNNVISECNGGCESPVKEEASPVDGSIDLKTINSACDENNMDESPTEPAPEGNQELVEEDEQGNGDADVNTGKLGRIIAPYKALFSTIKCLYF